MQSLPIGVPKFMLTTMASGDVPPYVGTRDICMMYPIAEGRAHQGYPPGAQQCGRGYCRYGISACHGRHRGKTADRAEDVGVTTPCVLRASSIMEKAGYDVIINHAVGSGEDPWKS